MLGRIPPIAVVATMAVLAGCSGGFAGPDTATPAGPDEPSPTATDEAPSQTNHETRNLSITNGGFDEMVVTLGAVDGRIESFTVTYENGSTRTLSRPTNESGGGWPYILPSDEVTAAEPANVTEVARWSTVLERNETLSLPTVASHPNATYLVVLRQPRSEHLFAVTVVECDQPFPTLERFELQVGGLESDGAGQPRSHSSIECE
jgi:hypothetical protein